MEKTIAHLLLLLHFHLEQWDGKQQMLNVCEEIKKEWKGWQQIESCGKRNEIDLGVGSRGKATY